ncbi:MAG: PIN domain-containing protein [Chloroflexi bacterium]|nr:PIN domain-containing protein [Chloroflexota bacterium]
MTILVDTSYLFALTNQNDSSHTICAQFAQTVREPLVIPLTVLPEIAYLLDARLGHRVMQQFVAQVARPWWTLEPITPPDLERTAELLAQYSDSRLDFVDATLVALAERLNVRRILTLDRRHFSLIRPRHCPAFELLPS